MRIPHLYAVILAGGSGTRFWPVSRKKKPKQFLEIAGDQTLLDLTVARIKPLINASNIFVITNEKYEKVTLKQLKKFHIPSRNILLEPQGKNTAPAVCWAAAHIHRLDPQAITAVLPSDHLILNQKMFRELLSKAVNLARQDFLVTFGITPSRPEVGYGYLKTRKKKIATGNVTVVERFTEKPSRQKALAFIKAKNYFWNSGMFVWKTGVILNEFKKFLPNIYRAIAVNPSASFVRKNWGKLLSISIDYGILEKADNVLAVEARNIGWSDLGSWESLMESLNADKDGNLFLGDVINVGSQKTLVYAKNKTVAVIGLQECIIVDTPDALVVCRKDQSQKIKDVVGSLKKKSSGLL